MSVPPVAGVVKLIFASALLNGLPVPVSVALKPVGVAGTVVAVIEFDAADAGPVPTEFVPVTVNV